MGNVWIFFSPLILEIGKAWKAEAELKEMQAKDLEMDQILHQFYEGMHWPILEAPNGVEVPILDSSIICGASTYVLESVTPPGIFKDTRTKLAITIDGDPLQAVLQCLFDRIDKIPQITKSVGSILKAEFKKELFEITKDFSLEEKKQLALALNNLKLKKGQ